MAVARKPVRGELIESCGKLQIVAELQEVESFLNFLQLPATSGQLPVNYKEE
jgi:hypothetical protein